MKLKILFQHKFSLMLFLLTTLIFCVLAFVMLFAAGAVDEGSDGNSFTIQLLAKGYHIVRFPTHTFFFDIMNGPIFLIGLFMNCLFYGFCSERIISLLKTKQWI